MTYEVKGDPKGVESPVLIDISNLTIDMVEQGSDKVKDALATTLLLDEFLIMVGTICTMWIRGPYQTNTTTMDEKTIVEYNAMIALVTDKDGIPFKSLLEFTSKYDKMFLPFVMINFIISSVSSILITMFALYPEDTKYKDYIVVPLIHGKQDSNIISVKLERSVKH